MTNGDFLLVAQLGIGFFAIGSFLMIVAIEIKRISGKYHRFLVPMTIIIMWSLIVIPFGVYMLLLLNFSCNIF